MICVGESVRCIGGPWDCRVFMSQVFAAGPFRHLGGVYVDRCVPVTDDPLGDFEMAFVWHPSPSQYDDVKLTFQAVADLEAALMAKAERLSAAERWSATGGS